MTYTAETELIDILSKQVKASAELLELANRKQTVLAADDLEALKLLLLEEEALAAELEKVEQLRLGFQQTYDTWPASLQEQLAMLSDHNRERATQLGQKLAETVEALSIQNKMNTEIIQHLLNFTAYNLEQLYKPSAGPAYGSRGDLSSVAGRAVVDRKI